MQRRALISMLTFAGCLNPYVDASPFGTGGGMPGGTDGSSGSTSTSGSTSSTGHVSEDSSVGGSAGTTLLLDAGVMPDLPPVGPPGCQGKIDFLFVISTGPYVDDVQEKLIAAVPQFIATIEEKFADFDYHIMVVDGDYGWGKMECNAPPCPSPGCDVEDYPTCEQIAARTECDVLMGSGVLFPAGVNASNKLCPIASGNRYLTRNDPDPVETFACMARVGTSGSGRLGEAMVHAISTEINGPGGCNEGFLRDDALLFVAFAREFGDDDDSEGTPETWREAVLDAKGDLDSVVMFAIDLVGTFCKYSDWTRTCTFIRQFPYWYSVHDSVPDYGPHFESATELIETACSQFIPR
jgi:hypothetical protein